MIRRAFTLVELLVVVTIIGLLVGLLLPAVMSARESGRRAQCANNLKQLGSACLQHEEGQGYYPSGGWGGSWVGDTTLGYGRRQPGSWLFSTLPNLDQDALYRLAGSDGTTATAGNQMAGAQTCIGTALPFMNCPSRRRSVPYPGTAYKPINASANPSGYGRSDYAANAGNVSDAVMQQAGPTATNFRANAGNVTTGNAAASGGLALSDANWQVYYTAFNFVSYLPNGAGASQGEPNGVIYTGSQIRKDDIIDGTTSTILLGEKYLNPNNYSNGADKGDSRSMYSGCSYDNERTTYGLNGMAGTPIRDRAEIAATVAFDMFGSAHVDICCFAFCDGSVHWIKYNIDVPTYQCLGCRNDGLTIDTSGL